MALPQPFSRFHFTNLTSISNASPAVFTLANHNLYVGDTIWLETTGALPTGLVIHTTYYVVINSLTDDTFEVSGIAGGTPINTSSAGSGTHSFIKTNRARLSVKIQDNE